jgi:hypothetical protein
MKRKVFTLVGVMATSLWSIASATTVTYNLGTSTIGGNGTTYSSPYTASGTGGSQTIAIYGETVTGNPDGGNPDDGGPGHFGSSPISLFSVTNGDGGNTASGMAPFVSSEGAYTNQNGITESDVLLLNLSQFGAGSTVQFVLETGINAGANTGINIWTGSSSTTPTGLGPSGSGSTQGGTNPLGSEPLVGGIVTASGGEATTTLPSTPLTLGANEWIAIQADCHYLLLDQIIVTPSGVPEPGFYGFIALAMVGLVFGARKLRARAAAAEQA